MSVDIEVKCTCGKDLDPQPNTTQYSYFVIEVEPCEDCLAEEGSKEHAKGYEEGERDASAE